MAGDHGHSRPLSSRKGNIMKTLRSFLRRLSATLGKKRPDRDLTAELESNIALNAADNELRGMDPGEARRQALIRFGAIEQSRQSYRQQETLPFLETFWHDTKYGLRLLRKNPGFTAIAVATLALGIGANSAIFSIVNGVLLRPLPYEEPGRLLTVATRAGQSSKDFGASPPDFRRLREQNQTLSSLSAYYGDTFNLTGADRPERVKAQVVSADFFSTLGVAPILGRAFVPGEEKWGSHRVMVVSEGFWRTHLNADPNFSGKSLQLDGDSYQVIGVLPSSFYSRTRDLQIWVPMAWKPKDNYDSHNNYFLFMIGRLKPGVTQAQASANLNSIMLAIAQEFPENKGIGVSLQPLEESWLGPVRPALFTLLAAVGLVLLIACVNLANLLLARGAGRQKEIGIRSALGAKRGRLLRQFITESVLLSFLGGAIGLGLAYFSLKLMPLAGDVLPRVNEVQIDLWVLLFTASISLATGVLFGLLPALQGSRAAKLNESLKEGRMAQAAESGGRIRAGLVISEVALALVLLIGSGLAVRSLQRLLDVDSGFVPEHVLTFQVSLPQYYDPNPDDASRIGAPPRVAAFYREFLDNIEHLPGVKAAGAGSTLPLRGDNWGKMFTPLDRPLPTSIDSVPHIQYRAVAGDYFQALGIHLVKGRLLGERDQADSAFSVVVNETLARKYWPNEDPIGKTLTLNPPLNLFPAELIPKGFKVQTFTVVGVVGDVHYGRLDQEPPPLIYAPVFQHDFSMGPNFAVRTVGDPTALVSSIRDTLKQFDKNLPLADLSTMDEIVSESTGQPRLEAILLGLFGALAMLLAAVGIYGVMSYTVSRRTSEIGLRMALGADRGDVLALICKQGFLLAGAGLAVGIVLALAGTRLMSKILFGISPTDPITFASIIVLLALVALLACYVPARRATRVDPLVALRYE